MGLLKFQIFLGVLEIPDIFGETVDAGPTYEEHSRVSRYQSRSSMYARGLIPWNFAELAKAVPIWYSESSETLL